MQTITTWSLRIAHLYSNVMNIYGDRGNTIALQYRAQLHGIQCQISKIEKGEEFEPHNFDIVVIGGGQDREQEYISTDLARHSQSLMHAVEDGQPMLAVCGGFQLFGKSYEKANGQKITGLGIFDIESIHPGENTKRCIGNVLLQTDFGEVVGFENHGGRSYLAKTQKPFGTVITGNGNNSEDNYEGAQTHNAIGTYLHGSLLPRNPKITDFILETALHRKYNKDITLPTLKNLIEEAAHKNARARALKNH